MNGAVIKEFLVGLGFQVDEQGLKKFEEGVKGASLAVAAIGAASLAAAGAVVAFVGSVADRLDSVGDAADRIGTTADELMRLQYVATLSGSSAEAATATMENLSRVIGEAGLGVGRGAMMFEKLGLKAKNADGSLKTTTQVLAEVGDKIKDLERGEQIAFLSKLGIDQTMIGAVVGGMQQLGAEFDALYKAAGVDLNQAAEDSGAFNDALDRLRMTFDAVKTAVAIKFMPQIARGIDTVRQFLVQNLPKIIRAVEPIFSIILRIAEAFITLAARIASGAAKIIGWFADINEATNGWAGYLLAAAAAWKFLNLAFLKTPLGMLLSLAAVVALLIDDFLTFKEGGESLIDWGSGFGIILQVVTSILTGLLAGILAVKSAMLVKAGVIAFTQGVMAAYTGAVAAFNGVMAVMRGVIVGAKAIMAAFNAVMLANPIGLVIAAVAALIGIGYLLVTNWETVKAWFVGLFNWFSETFPGITGFVSDTFKGAADAAIGIFTGVKDWFMGFFNWILEKFETIKNIAGAVTGFASSATEKASSAVSNAWGSVKGFFGGDSKDGAANTRPPALAPSPQAAAAVSGGQQNVNQQTQIVVQGGGNPEATARAVAGQQNRVNADMARNMKGAAR